MRWDDPEGPVGKTLVAIMFATFVFTGGVIVCAIYTAIADNVGEQRMATIVRVGGCDRLGYCGVTLDDGSHDTVSHPVEGQRVKVKVRHND